MSYIGNQPSTVAFLTDQFSGNASTTVFTMSVAPATTSSILVAVTGVVQDPSTYAVSGTTLTFSGAPPTGTGNISVRYLGIPASGVTTTAYRTLTEFTATAGQTSFSTPSYTVGFINVYRNGVLLGTADYTATTGTTVVLAVGALVGDLVTTESFYVSSVLNAIPATAGAVNSTYIANGAVTQTLLGTNVAGNGPAFSAFLLANQTITTTTYTKITINTEEFDTNSNYDNATNYRFTPTVAGYYQFDASLYPNTTVSSNNCAFYKNGAIFKVSSFAGGLSANCSALIYMNGSTDYVELYGFLVGVTPAYTGSSSLSYFQAAMVRSA